MKVKLQVQFIVTASVEIDIWVNNRYLNYCVLWFIQLQKGNSNIYIMGEFERINIVRCFETRVESLLQYPLQSFGSKTACPGLHVLKWMEKLLLILVVLFMTHTTPAKLCSETVQQPGSKAYDPLACKHLSYALNISKIGVAKDSYLNLREFMFQ